MEPAAAAVQAALSNDWSKAVALNKEILVLDPENIDALLRLAHANFEFGNVSEAQKCAKKALVLDPGNQLAKRCLLKCSIGKNSGSSPFKKSNLKAFMEIPGKTKSVHLVNLGEPTILAGLVSGEQVTLVASTHKVAVETNTGEHIGRLPDDIAAKLNKQKTTRFWAAIKSSEPAQVTLLIHER